MPSAAAAPLLRVSGVTHRFGPVTALWEVDLDVFPGDFVAIFGPNGAGKTTLLKIVASLIKPTRGEVHLGEGGHGRADVGYVSHQSLLYNEMTGLENLVFYARLYGLPDPPGLARESLLEMGLEEAAHALVRGYSRGMKQRLTLARALLHQPRLLLLDEPYTGLDQHGSRLLTEVLRSLREQGRTVLLITHNLGEGLELSTRVVIQHRGEIVFQADRQEVDRTSLESIYFRAVEGGVGESSKFEVGSGK